MDQRRDYKKTAGRGGNTLEAVAKEMRPPTQKPKASVGQRSINTYAKQTPADASGLGQLGLNVFTRAKPR